MLGSEQSHFPRHDVERGVSIFGLTFPKLLKPNSEICHFQLQKSVNYQHRHLFQLT